MSDEMENMGAFDAFIDEVVDAWKRENPELAQEVQRVVTAEEGVCKSAWEEGWYVCRLVYFDPKRRPLDLFSIDAAQVTRRQG